MRKTLRQLRILKKLPHDRGGDRAPPCGRQADRGVVRRRGPGRPEEQANPALGNAWRTTVGAARSTDRLGLHLRRDLPGRGQGRGAWSCRSATPRRCACISSISIDNVRKTEKEWDHVEKKESIPRRTLGRGCSFRAHR